MERTRDVLRQRELDWHACEAEMAMMQKEASKLRGGDRYQVQSPLHPLRPTTRFIGRPSHHRNPRVVAAFSCARLTLHPVLLSLSKGKSRGIRAACMPLCLNLRVGKSPRRPQIP